ncbi:restriction endonuclease subunit S [Microbacterium keratanolyticum]
MNVPDGWSQIRFDEVASLRNGLNFDRDATGAEIAILGVADFVGRDMVDDTTPLNRVALPGPLPQDARLQRGDLVFVRSNGSKALVGRSLIFEGTSRIAAFSGFTIRARLDANLADSRFVLNAMRTPRFRAHLQKLGRGSSINNLSQDMLSSFTLKLPPLPEQRKIAEILRTWDDAIDHTTGLRNKLSQRFSAVRERLLSPANSRPRLLSETTRELSARNYGEALSRDLVMGVSNRAGLVPMREHTIANDISRYRVLSQKGFAYNPMRINVGSIAMSEFTHEVLVSPDYVLFECDASALSPRYLNHVIRTRKWRHYVNAGAAGSVRTRTYYDDLARISIHTPTLAEQIRVAAALDLAKAEVDAVDRQLALLRKQKHGLMQKLLTGEVRVNVEDAT